MALAAVRPPPLLRDADAEHRDLLLLRRRPPPLRLVRYGDRLRRLLRGVRQAGSPATVAGVDMTWRCTGCLRPFWFTDGVSLHYCRGCGMLEAALAPCACCGSGPVYYVPGHYAWMRLTPGGV